MKNKDLYKGHSAYITWLGKFCAAFEHDVRTKIETKSDFIKLYPLTYNIFDKLIKRKVQYASIKKIPMVLAQNKVNLVFNGNKYLIFDFFRHLRNSTCHMKLEADDNQIYIYDLSGNKYTSKGHLSKNSVIEVIKTFVNEYETKYKNK